MINECKFTNGNQQLKLCAEDLTALVERVKATTTSRQNDIGTCQGENHEDIQIET